MLVKWSECQEYKDKYLREISKKSRALFCNILDKNAEDEYSNEKTAEKLNEWIFFKSVKVMKIKGNEEFSQHKLKGPES